MTIDKEHLTIYLVTVIIVLLAFSPDLYNVVKSTFLFDKTITICPVQYSGFNSDLADFEQTHYTNVADYSANIYISKGNYEVNNPVTFSIQIEDTSNIQKMQKPYFYALVFNPKGELKYTFPCVTNEPWTIQGVMLRDNKWTPWGTYNCIGDSLQVNSTCISRDNLISGKTGFLGIGELRYSFTPEDVGNWDVYVFLFDENYVSRDNVPHYSNVNSPNAISYAKSVLVIGSQTRATPFSLFILLGAIIWGIIGVFTDFDFISSRLKKKNRLERFFIKLARSWKLLPILILVFLLGLVLGVILNVSF